MWIKCLILLFFALNIHCLKYENIPKNPELRSRSCVSCVPIDPDNCEGKLELYPFENLQQNFT